MSTDALSTNDRQSAAPASEQQIVDARAKLNAWVAEVVDWHFDPATGAPFWLDYASGLSWDPRREVRTFSDLDKFDRFEDEWLRGGPLTRWVPKGYAGKPVFAFETGGTTGVPKSRVNIEDFRIDYSMFSETLSEEGFPRGADWLSLGPTGPRRLRLAVEHLAQVRGGILFCIDMDPRWFTKCLKRGWQEVAEAYRTHVIDQALTVIKAHPNIHCLFTTPKLLEALCDKISLRQAGIKGIFCGGTQMDAQFNRFAHEELLDGAEFVPTYGNTLMGLACHKPYIPEDDYSITYYAPQPRAALQVVDPDHPEREVEYGESGRVKLTTLTKEFFMPGFLERDEALRARPIVKFPWDGVRDVKPFSRLQSAVVVGVY